jgi:hypothetical protein
MKKLAFFFVVLCTLLLGSVFSENNVSGRAQKQRAVTQLGQPITVHGVVLPAGRYLFVHDDATMSRGEACTYIYKGDAEIQSKLVVSFHCTPVERKKVGHFTIRSVATSPGVATLLEFQFNGDTESHIVPAK